MLTGEMTWWSRIIGPLPSKNRVHVVSQEKLGKMKNEILPRAFKVPHTNKRSVLRNVIVLQELPHQGLN